MPYSERQLAQLSAMGLVAWVERPGRAVVRASGDPGSGEHEPATPFSTASGPAVLSSKAVVSTTAERLSPASAADPPSSSRQGEPHSSETDDDGLPSPPGKSEDVGAGRVDVVELPIPGPSAPEPGVADPLGPDFRAPPLLPMPMPREPAVLATWLPMQPLAPFVYRGQTLTRVGSEAAPLLIVVERGAPADGLPLTGEAAELFERMLRSIGLTRRDTRQCVLSSEPASTEADTLGAFATAPYRAMLVLMQELDGELEASGCRFVLDGTGAASPGWCLPHPDRLLREPLRKAQAWQVFKALRRHLGTGA